MSRTKHSSKAPGCEYWSKRPGSNSGGMVPGRVTGTPKIEQCQMVTYNGFFVMAGPPPRGVKPERCSIPAKANGFCEKHDPKDW